ncbi:hypothetical protein pipiens_004096 [Culex pipiens pipiens]|uniref:DUF4770 domain-containing protein n=1 Tax=Culex pipiens pipiens TaxID=38569 RepID=A0ABD1CPF3_CULPP
MDSPNSSSGRRYSGQSSDETYDERYKTAVAAYQNYMEGLQLVLSENELKMQKVLKHHSVPLWFQELSNEQVQAADALLEALRDDLDEGTHFRCRSLIRSLGVYPLCPAWVFKEAVPMSSGSDISFLWFLLGLHYSKNASSDYSTNERLIMSAICHLDMMTTLRGLEEVLPPRAQEKASPEISLSSTCHDWHRNVDHCSPYLEPLRVPDPRPKNWTGVRNFHPEAAFSLSRYAPYQDPHFIIPNEASRWFAKRTAGNQTTSFDEAVQTEEAEDPTPEVCDSAEQIVRELLNDQLGLMVRKEDERADLCRKHRDMEKRRRKLLGLITKRSEKR